MIIVQPNTSAPEFLSNKLDLVFFSGVTRNGKLMKRLGTTYFKTLVVIDCNKSSYLRIASFSNLILNPMYLLKTTSQTHYLKWCSNKSYPLKKRGTRMIIQKFLC
jgi:hypothetical protein